MLSGKIQTKLKKKTMFLETYGIYCRPNSHFPRFTLREKWRDTDPYSPRGRAIPGVSCSIKRNLPAACQELYFFPCIGTLSVARKIRSPDTSLKRSVSRPGNCLIHPDLLGIPAYRRQAQPIKFRVFLLSSRIISLGFDRSSTVLQV